MKAESVEIINSIQLNRMIKRLCYELIENHKNFEDSILIGVQPRGIYFAYRIQETLEDITNKKIKTGALDITFYRDDFRRRETPLIPSVTNIDFIIENKNIILIDDVLYTGRTIRAALDALIAWGRPSTVELMVLIDRRFTRKLPIQPNYVGKYIDTLSTEKVEVKWEETHQKNSVYLTNQN